MKKTCLLLLLTLITLSAGLWGVSATVTLRPTYIDIASATSESAVLMTLSGYTSNDARYRLYNGSNQYYCWDAATSAYISSTSYGSGPQALGTATTSTTFWILFQRGNNALTAASYRDRLGTTTPPYNTNYQTAALTAATSITTPLTLSGTYVGSTPYPLTNKYVALAYSGTTLISAASTALTTGTLAIVYPSGTTIDKIEIRDALNNLVTSITGSWSTTTNVGNIGAASAVVPTVTTASITSVTYNSASGGGDVTSDGGATVTARGVCWNTTGSPVATDSHTSETGTTGAFTSSLGTLSSNQLYYVRAYATNSAGTGYGDPVTFTTLASEPTAQPTSLGFSNVLSTSFDAAFTAASPTANGYIAIRKVGSYPTSVPVDGTSYSAGDALTDGTVAYSGSGVSFSQSSLSPSTDYYYCVYSFNGSGVSANYYTTSPLQNHHATTSGASIPTVTTTTITNNNGTTATGGGEVTADGGASVTARGICWSTVADPTIADSHTTDSSGTGVFTSSLTGLTALQLYHVRAYATNSAGTAYGSDITFTTIAAEPAAHVTTFTTGTATTYAIPLTWVDATATGYLIKGSSVGYGSIVAPVDGVVESNSALVRSVLQGVQTYTFTGLTAETTYYFKIYPYNGSTTNINYKLDSTVPEASTTTTAFTPEVLLTESFDYIAGTNLDTNTWGITGTNASPYILVSSTNLTYTDYPTTAGGSAALGSTGGQDLNKTFTAQSAGDVYCSFLVNVSAAKTAGDYFFHLGPNPISSDFKGRVFAKKVDASTDAFYFGFSKAGTNVTYETTQRSFNTTYLIAIKYSIVSGTGNDAVVMWVNPTIASTPPAVTLTATSTETDAGAIGAVGLRQGSSSNSCAAIVDEIRVATSWSLLLPAGTPTISVTGTLNPFTTVYPAISASQQYHVSGTNLTSAIHVAAPTGFELSLTGSRTWSSSVDISQTGGTAGSDVYVRFNPSAAGNYPAASIVHSATGATNVNKSVSGIAYVGEIVLTDTANITDFSGIVGTPTAEKTYHVQGSGLSNFIDLNVTGPFQIRDTSLPSPTWVTVLQIAPDYDGNIDVRYNPVAAGTQTGAITHSVDNAYEAANVVVNLSGTATDPAPAVTVLPATMSFTTMSGTSSGAQSCTVTSANQLVPVVIATTGAYTFCATESGTYTNPLQVATNYNGSIWIKFNPGSIGTFNNTITFTSGTATDEITVNGYSLDPNATYASDLFFSEYVEGSSNNKAFEIFNGTGHPVDMSGYRVELRGFGGSVNPGTPFVNTFNLTGTLANNSCYVIANSSANATLKAYADTLTSSVASFNGDDALVLIRVSDSSYVDIFGVIGDDPGTAWADGVYSAINQTLVRKASVYNGITVNPSGTGPTGFVTLTTEWDTYAIDSFANLGIHTFYPGASSAAAPEISPAAGIKDAPIMVSLSSTTPGAQIRYTTNGTDPTDASSLYTTQFEVSATTTVKARTYVTGYAPSSISSALYIFPTTVANIGELRTMTADNTTYYKISGEVIVTLTSPSYYHTKYIQDATNAIIIYDSTPKITTSYNVGDGVTGIVGQLQLYNGMLELIPSTDPGAATSTGNTITPEVITLSQLSSYHAKLVKIENVSFTTTGTFTTATNYTVSDASGGGVLRTQYSDLNYIGTAIPTTPKNIVGVVLQRLTTEADFIPRSVEEFTDAAAPDAPVNVVVTVSGNDINLTWTDDAAATSWAVYASDESPTSGFGTTPIAVVTTNSCTLAGDANTYGKRFYYVKARN